MARSRAQGPRRRGRDRRRRPRAVRRRAGRAARARTNRGPRERRPDERAAPQLPRGRCGRSIGRGCRPARGGGAPIELVSHPAFARLHPTGHHPESPRRLDVLQGAFLDWDVHHGNGTQAIFWDDESVLYVSLHEWPFYPGTGGPTEQRETTLNVPMSAGSGDDEYLHAFDHTVAPAIERFAPDLLVVSAGFDAHEDDPLAGMRVTAEGFRELARRSRELAPRVAAALEGG